MQKVTQRNGFTLIELLVVVAIIAVLATLVIGATMRFIQTQKETNTRTVLQTLDKALQQQWANVANDAKKETPSQAVYTLAGGDSNRAKVIWIKMRLMEAFPVSFAEILNNPLYTNGYIPAGSQKYIASYQKLLSGLNTNTNKAQLRNQDRFYTESSACLLMALSIKRGGTVLDPDSIASNIQDTDADGIKEIVDGWGNPILFYRFPTPDLSWNSLGTMALQSNNPAQKSATGSVLADPLDPTGTLLNSNWTNQGIFSGLCHQVVYPDGSIPPKAYYITPVIASAGSDGKFGLTLPPSNAQQPPQNAALLPPTTANPFSIIPANANDANDNLYNYLLRFGATGN
jgi:prepilin-type N-terminal cleavage/methylation domain-containing protein